MADADVFRALDDATRRAVLDLLASRDGRTLFDLCTALHAEHGISSTRQAVSHHLGVLEQAGLVTAERRGRSKFHHLDTRPLAEIHRRWPLPREDQP